MQPSPDRLPALGNASKPCHPVRMEAVGGFTCTIYRDREFQWLFGPKRCETFTTVLDLRDPRSLDNALVRAARRDAGDEADIDLYRLEVTRPDGTMLRDYRYSGYFDEAYDPAWD